LPGPTPLPEALDEARAQRIGRAKAGGIETELRHAVVYTVRDGKIARGREYIDRATALEAARLGE
jgi:ketosteroid isomerase-like protein